MPWPSSWNTPTRLARGHQLVGRPRRPAAGARGRSPRRAAPGSFTARSITVRVFRPRKSNFTRPALSTHFMLNWVAGMSRARIAVERHELGQRPVADDHAGGVGRGVAVEALQLQGDLQQVGDRLVVVAWPAAGAARSRSAWARVTGLAGLLGTILARRSTRPSGSCITRPTSRSTARACRVPKVMIWATRSRPYLRLHVGDHLLPPLLAEVDVEVGHRDPLGIEEALEQQAEAQRIEAGDQQRPGDQRAGARAAARAHRNARAPPPTS